MPALIPRHCNATECKLDTSNFKISPDDSNVHQSLGSTVLG